MTRCPHCQKICNPLRYFTYSWRRGYKCPDCGLHSEFNKRSLRWLGGAIGGFAGFFGSYYARHHDGWSGFGLVLLIGLFIGFIAIFIQFLFFRLQPKIDDTPSFPWDDTDAPKIRTSHHPADGPAVKIGKANKPHHPTPRGSLLPCLSVTTTSTP